MRPGKIALTPALVTFLSVLAFLAVLNFAITKPEPTRQNTNQIACTTEAKVCPDGSAVGRTGSKCEFTLCPGESEIDSFAECEAAGYPVGESHPRQCFANRQAFTEVVSNTNAQASGQASVFVWESGAVKQISFHDGTISSAFPFDPKEKLVSINYRPKTEAIVYITTSGSTDTLWLTQKGSDQSQTIDTLTRAGDGDVQQAARYAGAGFLNESYILGTLGFWEGCSDRVYSISDRTKLYDDWCGALGLSPNSDLFVKTTSNGIATGNSFQTTANLQNEFKDFDWSRMSGDAGLIYDQQAQQLLAGFDGQTFLSNDEMITSVTPNSGARFLASINFQTLTIRKLIEISEWYSGPVLVDRKIIFVANGEKLVYYDLDANALGALPLPEGIFKGNHSKVSTHGSVDDYVLVSVETNLQNDKYVDQALFAVQMDTKNFIKIVEGQNWLFAGVPDS